MLREAELTLPKILLVDDDRSFADAVQTSLANSFQFTVAECASEAFKALSGGSFDAILLDMHLPEITGLELLRMLRQRFSETPVVMVTGDSNYRSIVEAMKAGAMEYVVKGDRQLDDEIKLRIFQAIDKGRLAVRSKKMEAKLLSHCKEFELVGVSAPVLKLRSQLLSLRGTTASVLISGESGTGKELVARALHSQEPDAAERPYQAINCAALPEHLVESELFGHEKGAFTGAIQKQDGKFVAADGGDLFLDEIGELPMAAQAKLLRVLQDKVVTPVGSVKSVRVNVRVIAATNRDLREEVRAGRFREDLYYRISVIQFSLPGLRDRVGDIPILVYHFLRQLQAPHFKLTDGALKTVTKHQWPGNIRALRNCLERATIILRAEGRTSIEEHDLVIEDSLSAPTSSVTIPDGFLPGLKTVISGEKYHGFIEWAERQYFTRALEASGHNRTKLAEQLNVSRSFVHERLKAIGLTETSGRKAGSE